MANTETRDVQPREAIRRFDVFAEYTRQERLAKGSPVDEAKGGDTSSTSTPPKWKPTPAFRL